MKTLRFLALVFVIAFSLCSNSRGQRVIQKDIVATLYDGGIYYEGIGYVTGTYVYHFVLQVSKDGFITGIHWNAKDWDLHTSEGEWVKIIDAGHDSYGLFWDFWNNKDVYNTGYNISYDVPDGWLNEWLPSVFPEEGSFVDMSCKIMKKGKILDWSFMMQVHMNANGTATVNFVKP